MKTGFKTSTLICIIIVLVVFNISTLATIFIQSARYSKNNDNEEGKATSENAANKFSGKYFRDQLSFSNEQLEKFQQFNPEFRQNARAINFTLAGLRAEMLEEMSADVPDSLKLVSISDSVGILHSELKKITFRYYLQIRQICDTDQQAKLEVIFRDMVLSDGPTGGQNRYGQEGRMRGRQF